MDVGSVLSVAQNLYSALQCNELSNFGYKSQLDELRNTVETINDVLRDAGTKQEQVSHEAQNLIEELKDAVFEADDLFDEFVTLAEQKQLCKADGSLSNRVSNFFSGSQNPTHVAYRMSRGIKDIKMKLDGIASNSMFSFKLDLEATRKRRPETCSYADEVDIIGREDDFESIAGMLLDSNVQHDVSFLSIVGVGGLGKTALAKLVYDDPRVTGAFSLRLWTCVSDQDQQQLDVKEIVCKILGCDAENSTMDQAESELREMLARNKYLLVLDNVWTEKREQWCALESLLMGGRRGSWIVVTTRSQETSRIIGDGLMYKLQGLSDENSWLLFQLVAFGSDQQSIAQGDLVNIGQDIVGRCARVPLAIRVVAGLLYGQDKSRWQSILDLGLANIKESQKEIIIMQILKLSYHHLEAPLKSCFSFCAVFPKDFVMKKKMLISIWMAQGYIVPFDEGQSIDDAAEEYFSILSWRCFFQDIETESEKSSSTGMQDREITCKMHGLIHDIALQVSGKEISSANTLRNNLDEKVRHLFLDKTKKEQFSYRKMHIRSIFLNGTHLQRSNNMDDILLKALIDNCKWLRALHMSRSSITSLPESIGQLLHLRYLDLSKNEGLEFLPKSITKLYNLQTLELSECSSLKELPKNLSKLIKLRALNIEFCYSLEFMPKGMDQLSCLHSLSDFIEGGKASCSSSGKQRFLGLEDLKTLESLNRLKGLFKVEIMCPEDAYAVDKEGFDMRDKEYLNRIVFHFTDVEDVGIMDDEGTWKLMEEFEPHSNLRSLDVVACPAAKVPSWETIQANIVHLNLEDCEQLEYLSGLSNLRHLKTLELFMLEKLEYIEEDSPDELFFFHTLKDLTLSCLPRLKGWGRGVIGVRSKCHVAHVQSKLCFPQLIRLRVNKCPQLICNVMCPVVEELSFEKFNPRFRLQANNERNEVLKLKKVVSNVALLNSLPVVAFQCLESLEIIYDDEVESLAEIEEVFLKCSFSLLFFKVSNCRNLSSIMHRGLEHLTALEILDIGRCDNLRSLEDEKKGDGIGDCIVSCERFGHSLQSITLWSLDQVDKLPDWMQYLTTLDFLEVANCGRVESIPNWMPKLISLKKLWLVDCSEILDKRCRDEDWPLIQHIEQILF